MATFIVKSKDIAEVAENIEIDADQLPLLPEDELDVLSEIITVLVELRRGTRVEADQNVTFSRGPRLINEVYETMMIYARAMKQDTNITQSTRCSSRVIRMTEITKVKPARKSMAKTDFDRDVTRKVYITKNTAKDLDS